MLIPVADGHMEAGGMKGPENGREQWQRDGRREHNIGIVSIVAAAARNVGHVADIGHMVPGPR